MGLGIAIMFLAAVFGGCFVGWNYAKVWSNEQAGKAELANAKYSKLVAVEIAKAKNESAMYEAQAHITEAKGVAAANAIISDSITPEYIEYMYIQGLQDNSNKVIYVPTEASIPIIEAGRMANEERGDQ